MKLATRIKSPPSHGPGDRGPGQRLWRLPIGAFQRSISNPEIHFLLRIGLLALLIRVVFSFVVYPQLAGPLGLGVDPDYFGQLAQNWVDGKGYIFYEGGEPTTYRGPGYPLLLAALYLVFGNLLPVAVLAQCLIGALVCVVIYYVGKHLFGPWVGRTSALLATLHPLLIWYSPRLRYEPLLTLLLSLGIFWWLRARDSRSPRDAFLVGLFFGCAALVNQVIILLPLVLFAGSRLLKSQETVLTRQFVIALLTMVAIVAPWTVRNYQVSGEFIPVHSGSVRMFIWGNYEFEHYHEAPLQSGKLMKMGQAHLAQLMGFDPSWFDFRMNGIDEELLPHALSYVRSEPGKLLAKTIVQVPRFWYLSETRLKTWVVAAIQAASLLPAAIGSYLTLRSSWSALPFLLAVAYFNLVYAVTHVEARYSVPIIPFVVILAAVGLRAIVDAVRGLRRP
jgi:4-amino-4-deoxy-L-arabinose transferase-like glycosyltransferase